MKILFIYPNCEGYGRIPLSLSILSACLKKNSHEVRLFDLTFMVSNNKDNEMRERNQTAKRVDLEKYIGTVPQIDIKQSLKNEILNFQPDIIGITLVQNNYWTSIDLLQEIRKISTATIIGGGVFASVVPELLLNSKLIDIIVIGEGELALKELVERIENKKDFSDIKNIAFLKDEKIYKTDLREYINLDKVPFQDLSIFDKRHFLKPFDGKVLYSGYFELSRGCPFSCTYCVNYFLHETLYSNQTNHIRFKSINRCIDEINTLQRKYKFEFIFFTDENILTLSVKHLQKLTKLWKNKINLPFYMTGRSEFLTEDKIKILKEMGCATIAFGVECGNEEFRKKILKRYVTNEQIINSFKLCKKYSIRTTANNMFGFPYETEELIFDTIDLNKKIQPDSFSNSIFAPYLGTQLHDICVKEGFIKNEIPNRISMIDESILTMPQISKEKISELYFNFVKYTSKGE